MISRHSALLNLILACLAAAISAPVAANDLAGAFGAREMRVATVAYRLSIANRKRCEESLAPQPGFLVRGRGNDDIVVTAVMPDSPAEAAGLSAGDHLLSVNGRALTDRVPSRSATEHARDIVAQELADGPVTLQVAGRGGVRDLQFVPESGCLTNVALIEDEAVNAWADGTGIRITTSLLAQCGSDDDLALVLGHEMAHNLLRHSQRLAVRSGGASGLLPAGETVAQELHDTEEEADRVAVSLAWIASYDLTGAATFMDGLLDRSLAESETHPDPNRRLTLLREAIAEAQRDQVARLLPRG